MAGLRRQPRILARHISGKSAVIWKVPRNASRQILARQPGDRLVGEPIRRACGTCR